MDAPTQNRAPSVRSLPMRMTQLGARMDEKPTSGSARAVRCPSMAQRAATYTAMFLSRLRVYSVL